jgi:hypothetical protein
MSNDTVYYELVKRTIPYNPNTFVTAAIWSCSLCGKIGQRGAMYRWHFDNCKMKGK